MGPDPTAINSIETERLILRRFCETDLDEIAEVLSHPDVMRFSLSGPYSHERVRAFIDGCLKSYETRNAGLLAVIPRDEQRVIGYCGYYFQVIDQQNEGEIGYRLHPNYWGRGIATEAAIAVKEYGFGTLGYERMISIVEVENIASIRVAEKNGMTYEKDSIFLGQVPVRIYAIEHSQT
ncbi:hypothetical protein C1752_01639 [Acaryochloris thomasi RCC1774]|uniref:N-acetyltransferase domain-containing protein n=1 Tax=Acaryochloris thomasi RCC1774 TaxID=1764569 RepID=A0A2W1JKP3_9CYAN|nr:GNAT family N-acetyltransferase [Acaryochloris thomasi]PZD73949.1 hypothetical protein C1752_01639 [Acaryochloris thomasi RCC1774]